VSSAENMNIKQNVVVCMNLFPLGMIFSYPINIQLIYFGCCLLVAIFGINKKMGFWGYLFFSMIFSPILGLVVLAVSGTKKVQKE
jgi:hypothetical protein